ncbi:unnamed protein product [Durusdinium trenchii]|uniref:Uncharacterized protein n=2 Tax=Durusdinium trenchii TaxID=1381693 RepID=A0ABP0IUV1_9DINO
MVKEWIVKSGIKSHLRKQPLPDSSEQNVVAILKSGDSVYGEFLFIRRASRESGFLQLRQLEPQGGSKWLVSSSTGTALLRKHPTEEEAQNVVGYAMDGELVDGEFLFCMRRGEKRGGYVKVKHLKPVKERSLRIEPTPDPVELAKLARALRSPGHDGQRWAVLDAGHDGAWLRRRPSSDRSPSNILCLVPNGAVVDGDWLYLQRGTDQGLLRFRNLRQEGPKLWRLTCDDRLRPCPLPSRGPSGGEGVAVKAEEMVEGEYVLVSYKDGKHQGYIKRHYLIAMALPSASAPEPPAKRARTGEP